MKFVKLLSLNNAQGYAELVALADNGTVWVWQSKEQKWTELKKPTLRAVPSGPPLFDK
jgi:alpha-tubulin suppressor-like RCC1 family protein